MAKASDTTGTTQAQTDYQKLVASQIAKVSGSSRSPNPPRDLHADPGSRKIVFYWAAPEMGDDIDRYDVARGTESNIVANPPATVRKVEIPATASASSPTVLLAVRSVSKSGRVSQWVYTTGKASDEAGAPADPTIPDTYYEQPGGGGEAGRERTTE